MTDDAPHLGPSRETLLNLRAMLPSFKKAMQKGQITGKGKPVLTRIATKVCMVCGVLHAFQMLRREADNQLGKENCERCQGLLNEGWTAVTYGEKFAFIQFQDCSNYNGQILHVGPNDMAEIERRYGAQKKANAQAEPPEERR